MAYHKKVNQWVEVDGGIFDPNMMKDFAAAMSKGIEKLGEEGQGILAGAIAAGGFVRTGSFLHSVDTITKKDSTGVSVTKVRPTDVWPAADRPTRTWFEKGTRGGVKMRKGIGGFAKTTNRLKGLNFQDYFDVPIERVLK